MMTYQLLECLYLFCLFFSIFGYVYGMLDLTNLLMCLFTPYKIIYAFYSPYLQSNKMFVYNVSLLSTLNLLIIYIKYFLILTITRSGSFFSNLKNTFIKCFIYGFEITLFYLTLLYKCSVKCFISQV